MTGWYSQEFPPGGASAAEGIRNQLGRPALNQLTVLVRESAQNSWDARLGTESVRFSIDLSELPAALAPRWRAALTTGAPANVHLPLRESLGRRRLRILSVSDRGTRGLGGPTRADNAVVRDNDFVSFIRNIGEPRNTELGGGTYGFGKGIFYLLSRCGTVLIHTRCRTESGYETRLIGCSLWKSYTTGDGMAGKRYTGRHWWGDDSSDIIEPLIGRDAEQIAAQLRLTPFGDHETGTTITIIDPELDMDEDDLDADSARAVEWMVDAIAWNLWPKMIAQAPDGAPSMIFSVSHNGIEIPIPDPATTEPLRQFVQAYRLLGTDKAEKQWVKSPKIYLGKLALQRTMAVPFRPSDVAAECGFGDSSHHVCLMRSPELVVKYWKGPATAAKFSAYAGVFRADDDVDDAFAKSEPPTHDDWVSSQLDGRDMRTVRGVFNRLKDATQSMAGINAGAPTAAVRAPLGAASRQFSALVVGAAAGPDPLPAPGPSSRRRRTATGETAESSDVSESAATDRGRHRSARRPRLTYSGDPTYGSFNGTPVIEQEFAVAHHDQTRVTADIAVVVPGDKGRETSPPAGAPIPTIVGWTRADGSSFETSPELLHPGDGSSWKIIVVPAPDTITSITLAAQTEDGGTR